MPPKTTGLKRNPFQKAMTQGALDRMNGRRSASTRAGTLSSKRTTADNIKAVSRHVGQNCAAVILLVGTAPNVKPLVTSMKLSSLRTQLLKAHQLTKPEAAPRKESDDKTHWEYYFADEMNGEGIIYIPEHGIVMNMQLIRSLSSNDITELNQLMDSFFVLRHAEIAKLGFDDRIGDLQKFFSNAGQSRVITKNTDPLFISQSVQYNFSLHGTFALTRAANDLFGKDSESLANYNEYFNEYISGEIKPNASKTRTGGVYTSPYRLIESLYKINEDNNAHVNKPAETHRVVFDCTMSKIDAVSTAVVYRIKTEPGPKHVAFKGRGQTKDGNDTISLFDILDRALPALLPVDQQANNLRDTFIAEFARLYLDDVQKIKSANQSYMPNLADASFQQQLIVLFKILEFKGYKIFNPTLSAQSSEMIFVPALISTVQGDPKVRGTKINSSVNPQLLVLLSLFCRKFGMTQSDNAIHQYIMGSVSDKYAPCQRDLVSFDRCSKASTSKQVSQLPQMALAPLHEANGIQSMANQIQRARSPQPPAASQVRGSVIQPPSRNASATLSMASLLGTQSNVSQLPSVSAERGQRANFLNSLPSVTPRSNSPTPRPSLGAMLAAQMGGNAPAAGFGNQTLPAALGGVSPSEQQGAQLSSLASVNRNGSPSGGPGAAVNLASLLQQQQLSAGSNEAASAEARSILGGE